MHPKDKALELIEKFKGHKEFALTAIVEILSLENIWWTETTLLEYPSQDTKKYWELVKWEIIKMHQPQSLVSFNN